MMKDCFGYKGKKVVVTGAASGMGKAAAALLAELGAEVYALDWADASADGIKAYIHTDLSRKESIDGAFEQLPERIDSFFGIAGVSGLRNDFLTTVKIDLISNKYICEKYLPERMTDGGSIAFMTSTAGIGWEKEGNKKYYLPVVGAEGWDDAVKALEDTPLTALPGNLGYSFSKLAMNYMVAKLQAAYAPRRIRVNAVLPGSTDTGLKADFTSLTGGEDNLLKYTGYAGRLAKPEEMAGPIVFLNSGMASYVSGELMVVDFGISAEVEAGIKPDPTGFTFETILQKIAPNQTE